MQLFSYTKPKMIVASPNKFIRSKNDVYKEEIRDIDGNITEEEHLPYYSTTVFVPDTFKEDDMYDLYVEEDKLTKEEVSE